MEIPRGSVVLKAKILKANCAAKMEFPGGRGLQNKKLQRGSMDIFWNCTINEWIN